MRLIYTDAKTDEQGLIYSLDLIRINTELSGAHLESFLTWIDHQDNKDKTVRIEEKSGALKYRYLVLLMYENGGVVKMGFLQNDVPREQSERGFIEFNPNALAGTPFLEKDWPLVSQFFADPEIARFDLAIDIPVRRDLIALEKDQRKYSCQKSSNLDFTEYLGRRNHVGRVKLYNKQLERNLSKPLTRIEVTGDLYSMNIPTTYDLRNLPKSYEEYMKLVICNDNITQAMSMISNYKRRKIRKLLENNRIEFDADCIEAIRQQAVAIAEDRFDLQFIKKYRKGE